LVSENGDSKQRDFETRSRELLRADAERLSAAVRSRLTQARFKALEEAQAPSSPAWVRALVPAGGLAAAALVAVIAWRGIAGNPEFPASETGRGDVLEVVAMADDYDALEDDVEFYQWLDTEPDANSPDVAGVG
jgi:hypothetical protein